MNHNPRIWDFIKPKDFREQVLKLPKSTRPKLTDVMRQLSQSDNPLALGKKKITKHGVFYTIKLDPSNRLSYDVFDFKNRKIIIYRVGDHNFVYGKK